MIRVGITLPSFVEDPEVPLAVARAAEDAGLDSVFAYEHLFRFAQDGRRRPALDCWATLGAVAAETRSLLVGPLAARASLRPPAVLAHACETVQRVSGGRVLAVVGAGDRESRQEDEEFGLPFGSLDSRVAALGAALDALVADQVPTWVGGTHARVLALAARCDGWNRWGGDADKFARDARVVLAANPNATLSWSGLVVLGADDDAARDKAQGLRVTPTTLVGSPSTVAEELKAYVDAGASWLILAPVDSSDPSNAALAAGVRSRLG